VGENLLGPDPWVCNASFDSDRYDRYTGHMSKQVTATMAKASILRLLDEVATGEEVEITRHGRPVARLVPAAGARSLKGSFEGLAMTASDEEDLFSTGEPWDAG
jgi:prevent-host-death family protein